MVSGSCWGLLLCFCAGLQHSFVSLPFEFGVVEQGFHLFNRDDHYDSAVYMNRTFIGKTRSC